jgi:hypothetical protein
MSELPMTCTWCGEKINSSGVSYPDGDAFHLQCKMTYQSVMDMDVERLIRNHYIQFAPMFKEVYSCLDQETSSLVDHNLGLHKIRMMRVFIDSVLEKWLKDNCNKVMGN